MPDKEPQETGQAQYPVTVDDKPTKKELFQHLFAELGSLYQTYIQYVLATTTSQIIVLGWFLSSDKTSKGVQLLQAHCRAFNSVIAFFIIIELVISRYLCNDSQKIGTLLRELDYTEDKHYKFKEFNWPLVIAIWAGHVVLYLLLSMVVANI